MSNSRRVKKGISYSALAFFFSNVFFGERKKKNTEYGIVLGSCIIYIIHYFCQKICVLFPPKPEAYRSIWVVHFDVELALHLLQIPENETTTTKTTSLSG